MKNLNPNHLQTLETNYKLPVFKEVNTDDGNNQGRTVVCWRLTFRERLSVLFTGKIWHQYSIHNKNTQPQKLHLLKPNFNDM